jgi:hypothetical protein
MLVDQSLDLGNQIFVALAREVGIDPQSERDEAKFFEPQVLAAKDVTAEIGERFPAPEVERGGGGFRGLGWSTAYKVGTRALEELLESRQVDGLRIDSKGVAARLRLDGGACSEGLPKVGNSVLESSPPARRGVIRPELVEEPIGRDDPIRVNEEERQELALPAASDWDQLLAVSHFDRPKDEELRNPHSSPHDAAARSRCAYAVPVGGR